MNKDAILINEALDVFRKLRDWIPADYYRIHVVPVVNRLKERLAVIETEAFMKQRVPSNQSSNPFEKTQSEAIIEQDTIPSQLMDLVDQFGLFKPDPNVK